MKFQTPQGVDVLHPQSSGHRKTPLEHHGGRTVWTLGRKEPSPSDCSPVRRVVHKLLVKKEAALVSAKVRECGTLAISFYPELQSGSAASIQRSLQLRWDRCAK